MTPRISVALSSAVLGLVLAAVGCGREEPAAPEIPPLDPRSAALAVFEIARLGDPDRETVAAVFDEGRLTESLAVVLDAVAPLAEFSDARIVDEVSMPGVYRVAIDLEVSLAGEGSAAISIQSEEQPDGTWRVVSVLGPGVDWPPRPARGDAGATTSAPP
jgi:hypothetical protein